MPIVKLDRSVLRLSGDGVGDWLSGLITNTLSGEITFAALLTPQGKIIADFFVHTDGDNFLLDTASKFAEGLLKRLKMYRLRAPIEIEIADLHVYAFWDGAETEEGVQDPRDKRLGRRLISADVLQLELPEADYDRHRLTLCVPDSGCDFETQSVFPADANMDLLSGVDFKKGCFIGQEVVSRMHRKTTVRKRMRGLELTGSAAAGDDVLAGERVIGQVLHVNGNLGMGLIRLDRLEAASDTPSVSGHPIKILG